MICALGVTRKKLKPGRLNNFAAIKHKLKPVIMLRRNLLGPLLGNTKGSIIQIILRF